MIPQNLSGEQALFSSASDKPATERAQHVKAMLEGEHRKVVSQKMVLAIVGTRKANKSITINAIVGTEVLPNRNRPMTALPTYIRHRLVQILPLMFFPHVAPIKALMGQPQTQLKTWLMGLPGNPGVPGDYPSGPFT